MATFRNISDKYSDAHIVTIGDYRELNPNAIFIVNVDAIWELDRNGNFVGVVARAEEAEATEDAEKTKTVNALLAIGVLEKLVSDSAQEEAEEEDAPEAATEAELGYRYPMNPDFMEEYMKNLRPSSNAPEAEEEDAPEEDADEASDESAIALKHYNSHYNNETYGAVQVSLVRDLCGSYQADDPKLLEIALGYRQISEILALLTAVCLEISGYPQMEGRRERLITALAVTNISGDTVRLMSQHMEDFEETGSQFSADFENTTLALLCLQKIDLSLAKAYAGAIHNSAGTSANDLIVSASYQLELAKRILGGGRPPSQEFIGEMLHQADRHFAGAMSKLLKPATPPMTPHKTLLLSSDGTHVGLVTAIEPQCIRIVWYKWGFTSKEVVRDWEYSTRIDILTVITPEACAKRFGGLPPAYDAE